MGEIGISPLLNLEIKKRKTYEYITYIGSLAIIPIIILLVSNSEYTNLFMYIIGPCSLLYLFYEMRNFSLNENKKLLAALVFILFSIVFWAFFEQSGGSLSAFAANNLNNTVAGLKLDPNGVNNSANSFFCNHFCSSGRFGLVLDEQKKN
jgi:POT family proton-dependent oligopeptide transporter